MLNVETHDPKDDDRHTNEKKIIIIIRKTSYVKPIGTTYNIIIALLRI